MITLTRQTCTCKHLIQTKQVYCLSDSVDSENIDQIFTLYYVVDLIWNRSDDFLYLN